MPNHSSPPLFPTLFAIRNKRQTFCNRIQTAYPLFFVTLPHLLLNNTTTHDYLSEKTLPSSLVRLDGRATAAVVALHGPEPGDP